MCIFNSFTCSCISSAVELITGYINSDILYFSDDDIIEAVAGFDYEGRSERELSFRKGDNLLLYTQVSDDWWEGAHQGKEGLIPDKYVHIKR